MSDNPATTMGELHVAMEPPPRRGFAARLRSRAAPLIRRHNTGASRPKRNIQAVLREWHKRVGLFAFFFMGWLGASGFVINQSAAWGYDTVRIDWGWVMALYGLHPEAPASGFSAGGRWLAVTADYTLLNATPLSERIAEPLGVVAGGSPERPLLFVATPGGVVMLTADGQRYDELRSPILPITNVRRIGTTDDGAIAVQDLDAYQSTDSGDNWTPVDPTRVHWSTLESIPEPERERMLPYSRPSVSLEHVLVDAHSGRIFGSVGAWVINFVGFSALWLAISGVWMWWRIRKNRRPQTR